MKDKLFKTGDQYLLRSESKEVLAISNGSTEGRKLSLKNCQAIERGYDLDELADKFAKTKSSHSTFQNTHKRDFREGFQKALEILGDKKFSEEDVRKAITGFYMDDKILIESNINKQIQSLQQNEWDVEIEMEDCFTKNEEVYVDETNARGNYSTHSKKPKLDADGCLVLKRVTN